MEISAAKMVEWDPRKGAGKQFHDQFGVVSISLAVLGIRIECDDGI